jgi:hypothetical protein
MTGVRDMPDRGPNNETPAAGLDTCGVNYGLPEEASMKFVGWDWASTSHDVTVLDDHGRVLERWALRHTEQGLARRWRDLPVMASRPSSR